MGGAAQAKEHDDATFLLFSFPLSPLGSGSMVGGPYSVSPMLQGRREAPPS